MIYNTDADNYVYFLDFSSYSKSVRAFSCPQTHRTKRNTGARKYRRAHARAYGEGHGDEWSAGALERALWLGAPRGTKNC